MYGQTDAVPQPRRSAAGPWGRLIHAVEDGRTALQPGSWHWVPSPCLVRGPPPGARSLRRHSIDAPAMTQRRTKLPSVGSSKARSMEPAGQVLASFHASGVAQLAVAPLSSVRIFDPARSARGGPRCIEHIGVKASGRPQDHDVMPVMVAGREGAPAWRVRDGAVPAQQQPNGITRDTCGTSD